MPGQGRPFVTMRRMDGLQAPPAEPGTARPATATTAERPASPAHRPRGPASAASRRSVPTARRPGQAGRCSPRTTRLMVAGGGGRGGGRHRPALRGQLRHVARRGADPQHRPAAARADPRRPAPRRRAAALLLPAALLDAGPSAPPTRPCGPLSGVLSCATLPFVWMAGRRLGGRTVAAGALVLVATSPFAIRYATENRMYAARGPAHRGRRGGPAAGPAPAHRPPTWSPWPSSPALLLYTHYWALYLVGVTGLWLAFQAWRGPERAPPGARVALVAVVVGCLTLRALGAHVRLPGPPHRDAVGQAGRLRRHGQRRDVVRGRGHQPGPGPRAGVLRPGRARALRRGPGRVPRRPRPAHPAPGPGPGAGAHRHAGRRGGRADTSAAAPSRPATPRSSSCPSCSSWPSGLATFADRRIRAGVLAATVAFGLAERPAQRLDEPHPGGRGGRHAGPAGSPRRRRGLLPRPDRAGGEPPGAPRPLPRDHLPPWHRARSS